MRGGVGRERAIWPAGGGPPRHGASWCSFRTTCCSAPGPSFPPSEPLVALRRRTHEDVVYLDVRRLAEDPDDRGGHVAPLEHLEAAIRLGRGFRTAGKDLGELRLDVAR